MRRLVVWIAAALLFAAPAVAQEAVAPTASHEVLRAPVPAWVVPLSEDPLPPIDAAPVRVLAIDHQVRFDAAGKHTYTFGRIRIQTVQGLGLASTVNAAWNPAQQTIDVHAVRIIRDDQVIDVLAGQTFQTLRRERNLESSMLDGVLTATLQPRDLRVGDILESAFTLHDDGGVLAPHQESVSSAPTTSNADRYRFRATWPADRAMRVQVTEPWAAVQPRRTRDGYEVEINDRDLRPIRVPGDLPYRFWIQRTVQISDLTDWNGISIMMAPLYEKAAILEDGSPLTAEIERIRVANPTVEGQVSAVLRLVQEDVRYLALAMGQGGYVPATADETWRSRYGDCKAKTVLILALLKGLGIEAEPALVSTRLGDGLDQRLPMVSWFDHVIVRVVVDGQVHWIDGAGRGDRALADISAPPYRWGLPVRTAGAALEPIVQTARTTPDAVVSIHFDASDGLDAKARVSGDFSMSGDAAATMHGQLANLPDDQRTQTLEGVWEGMVDGIEIETTDTRYDEVGNTLHFLATGKVQLAWTTSAGGRSLSVPNSGVEIAAAAEREEPFEAFKDQPYAINHPQYILGTVSITLPNGGEGFRLEGADVVVEAAGNRIERRTTLENGVVTMTGATRSLVPEVTAAQMAEARAQQANVVNGPVRVRAPANYRATEADRARYDTSTSDVDDLLERAEALVGLDDLDAAIALLDRAIELEPENIKPRNARGFARLGKDDYAGAREDFDQAVDLDPADTQALIGQGRVAAAEGRFNDAIVSYSVAIRLDPADLGALNGRANAYYQIGRADRSLADFRSLQAAAPTWAGGKYGEVRALIKLKRLDDAQRIVDAMIAESAVDAGALGLHVRLAIESGQPARALPALDAAVTEAPADFGLRTLRAEMRVRSGDEAGARADYVLLRQAATGDPVLLNNVCWSQGTVGFDLDQALADCDAALAVLAEAAFVIDSRAMVLLHLERYAEAKAAYEAALAGDANQLVSIYGLGLARLGLGDAGGREDIDRALKRSIDSGEDFDVFEARHPELTIR